MIMVIGIFQGGITLTSKYNFTFFFQRRSLRERKKKTYKDDFDYNLSDEEGEKEPTEGGVQAAYPGDIAGQGYIPVGPEVEETTTVEKILSMRTKQVRSLLLYKPNYGLQKIFIVL